jgi:hypothetical protein
LFSIFIAQTNCRMITFDRNGNPQPLGCIPQHFNVLKPTFVDAITESTTRRVIFTNYERYIGDFSTEVAHNFKQWINGSFTTTKVDPNDIDLVNHVYYTDDMNLKADTIIKYLTQGGSKDTYLVDGYFIPVYDKNDPRYSVTEHWTNYWFEHFGKDRKGNKKGIIEITFS